MLYSALPFYQSAWIALRRGQVNMDVPITLGLLAGFIGSLWATFRNEGVVYYDTLTMLIFFLLVTRFLERNAREKSVEAAENLLRLAPAMATRLEDGQGTLVPVMDLIPGDLILTKPGETIAADGVVDAGTSSVDESLLTGESRPLPRCVGDKVVAGSINYESPLTIKVTEVGKNTVLAGIARLLDRAQAEKPRMAQTADRLAAWFTYVLLAVVAVAGLAWWVFDPSKIFDVVLSVLVVSCPCALSLAAPAAFAAAGSHLVRRGVLLTRGHALETLAKATHIAFDKTGTLTLGKPALVDTHAYGELDARDCLEIAASLEQASEHPLAQSFLSAVDKQHLRAVAGAQNLPGQGVSGVIAGVRYTLGNVALTPQFALPAVKLQPGATVVWLCDDQRALAAFTLADTPRPQAAELIAALRKDGLKVSMLSGDMPEAAAWHAKALGIDDAQGGLSPDRKLEALKAMQRDGEIVAMVGDGVNDAPVLAGAPVSIAMGSGTQMARTSGDIVLLSENLMEIRHARIMSRFTMSVIRQNFLWSLAYNLIAVPVAVAGYLSPWLAALGMSVSSLVVVLNALRLR
jgi:Cu2+-exporting ATPase